MQAYSISPQSMVGGLWRNREIILALTRREVVGRYRGSVFGIFWSFFNPVLMLVVYTFVFGVVFKGRWVGGSDSKVEFAFILFAGMMVFGLFSECVNRAPGLVLSNQNYVKKIVFPLEVLPVISLGTALFHLAVSLLVWLISYPIFFGLPHWTVIFFPVVISPLVLLTLGLSWIFSSLGVYLRDIAQVVNVGTTALLFLTPIFYPVSSLPAEYQFLMKLNPMTVIVEQSRNLLVWGREPAMLEWCVSLLLSFLVAWTGYVCFQMTRKGFADVL